MADIVGPSLKIRDWDAAAKLAGIIALAAGQLALVAQDKVFMAIRDFIGCADGRACTKGSLALYSRNVARACRTSLEDSWKVNLPPLPTSDSLP